MKQAADIRKAVNPDEVLFVIDAMIGQDAAQQAFDEEEARKVAEKLANEAFTLEDFLEQLQQMKKMGSMKKMLGMLPGMGQMKQQLEDFDEREIDRTEAIIRSMTPVERRNPKILNGSRRLRIARGSGMTVTDVNQLVQRFEQAAKMMKTVARGGTPNIPGMGPGGERDHDARHLDRGEALADHEHAEQRRDDRAEDDEGDPRRSGDGGGRGDRSDTFPEHERPESQHDERLRTGDGGSHPAGEAFGREEQQREERADVEGAEHEGLTPPDAVRQAPGQQHREEARRKRAEEAGEERMPSGEHLRRHQIGRTPRRRREGRDEGEREAVHAPSLRAASR
ncbi:unnamed protein product [Penicillium discolor]